MMTTAEFACRIGRLAAGRDLIINLPLRELERFAQNDRIADDLVRHTISAALSFADEIRFARQINSR